MIIPDGILYSIPFDILYDTKSESWILEKYVTSTYPNLYNFYTLNFDLKYSSNNSFLGLGNPVLKQGEKNNDLDEINATAYELSKLYSVAVYRILII